MPIVLLVIGLAVVGIVGVSSTADSYAEAQQAQAIAEVAKVAQVTAYGNLVTILTTAVVVLVLLMAVLAVGFVMFRRSTLNHASAGPQRLARYNSAEPTGMDSEKMLNLMLQAKILEMLQTGTKAPQQNMIEAPKDESVEPFHWLR
jgi:heme exporter protein D